jgi:hypothetical protein
MFLIRLLVGCRKKRRSSFAQGLRALDFVEDRAASLSLLVLFLNLLSSPSCTLLLFSIYSLSFYPGSHSSSFLLDYFLYRQVTLAAMCVQHVTLPLVPRKLQAST